MLDSLDEFVSFDKAAFIEGFVGAASDTGAPEPVVECLTQSLEGISEEELQSIYLSGDEAELTTIFEGC